LSFAAGLFVDPDEGPVLANTGLDTLRFLKPVQAGARISVRLTVMTKTRRTDSYGEVRGRVVAWACPHADDPTLVERLLKLATETTQKISVDEKRASS